MKAAYALELVHSDEGFAPFSNGSEGAMWADQNCDRCRKCYACRHPEKYETEICKDGGVALALSGLNCFGEYAYAAAWITGVIHPEISEWMGGTETELPSQCIHFTDDEKDDPENQPDPIDPRQLKIPFICAELFGFTDPNILVFDKAIIHIEDFANA